ncbi:pseudouridine synthase deg1 [Microbotryomycetes sp. JL201]|nr:pseudouridine synthase deg1 [Microbotryomycetes sp. JL201]
MSGAIGDERAAIAEQIAQLERRLKRLDTHHAAPDAPLHEPQMLQRPGSAAITGHPGKMGPLPPALARQPKRHIALLFSYEGWEFSGMAYQPPRANSRNMTVEGVMLEALERARLIEPRIDADGFACGFERCGRTDAGVSSSAQVINLWVRSTLADPMGELERCETPSPLANTGRPYDATAITPSSSTTRSRSGSLTSEYSAMLASPVADDKSPRNEVVSFETELPYVNLINRHLPPSVRVLAWSPVSRTFSSRHSCIWRHYKYFFSSSGTQPLLSSKFDFGSAYPDAPNQHEWQTKLKTLALDHMDLDVGLMRQAASYLVGEHDFRNLCKLDPPKQLPTHRRTVVSATIDSVEGEEPDMFVLNLRGNAFLYNQVRHIIALLFLVGARLEKPEAVKQLLWTTQRTEATEKLFTLEEKESLELVQGKPGYELADHLPLILWKCGFNSTDLSWRIDQLPRQTDLAGPSSSTAIDSRAPRPKLPLEPNELFRRQYLDMYQRWTEARLHSIILRHHLASFAQHSPSLPDFDDTATSHPAQMAYYTPNGAGKFSRRTTYVPLLQRKRGDSPEMVNERWAKGRGAEQMAQRAANREQNEAARELKMAKKRAAFAEKARLEAEQSSQRER